MPFSTYVCIPSWVMKFRCIMLNCGLVGEEAALLL
jgi:hypothetical protein